MQMILRVIIESHIERDKLWHESHSSEGGDFDNERCDEFGLPSRSSRRSSVFACASHKLRRTRFALVSFAWLRHA
jgi:hypothetical protein